MKKRILCPHKIRRVPNQFSWIDQQLVRKGYVELCSPSAMALYLILVIVADANGISFYGDTALCRLIGIDNVSLDKARKNLVQNQLIAYEKPFYQVLDLAGDADNKTHPTKEISDHSIGHKRTGQTNPIGNIIDQFT